MRARRSCGPGGCGGDALRPSSVPRRPPAAAASGAAAYDATHACCRVPAVPVLHRRRGRHRPRRHWWVIGPRRPLAAILPVLASFGALYLVGHKSGLAVGPTVELFGFEVNLLWDLLCAVMGAAIVAKAQCYGHRRCPSRGI